MKIIFTLLITTINSALFAQTQVQQGSIIIDPYFGVPNWENSFSYGENFVVNTETATDYSLNGGILGYGCRGEFMLADNFGLGFDVNYVLSGYNYNDVGLVYDENTASYTQVKYNYDLSVKKLRVMARMNYHFAQTDRIDAYTAFAAGYKNVRQIHTSSDPNSPDTEQSGALFPVSLRLAIGTRVFINEVFGLNMEIGIFGGALLQVGASFKIPTYY